MYASTNFKTKKALKEAVASGQKITCFQPGPFGSGIERGPKTVCLEGPHYPAAHAWYSTAEINAEGHIIKVK